MYPMRIKSSGRVVRTVRKCTDKPFKREGKESKKEWGSGQKLNSIKEWELSGQLTTGEKIVLVIKNKDFKLLEYLSEQLNRGIYDLAFQIYEFGLDSLEVS